MLLAFSPTGNPVFQPLIQREILDESDYILLWKSYVLALVGNWLIKEHPGLKGELLDNMLTGLDLKTQNVTPQGAFSKILAHMPNFLRWTSAECKFSIDDDGTPSITPKVEFATDTVRKVADSKTSIEDAFRVLNECLESLGIRVWVTFDRLDEAFQGKPDVEVAALRGLLRSYLDLLEFGQVKLKLFLRRDLFPRVTAKGFVNLTHINSRKLEILWDEEDLLNLLARRVRQSSTLAFDLGVQDSSNQELFSRIFPEQVDFGKRKPKTWIWIMRRIRDGNDVKPPRNLIDLVRFAQQAQLRREDREGRLLSQDPVLEPDSLRKALTQLSKERVNDTLFAEAGVYAQEIEKFRGGKAEHDRSSLASTFGVDTNSVLSKVKPFVELGFFEEVSGSFKIPTLYREGLEITQGKAFSTDGSVVDEDD